VLSGLCLFLVGSIISAAANSLAVLVAARLVQAIGAGCGMTLVRTIARDAYGPARLVRAIAYLTMFYTLGPMISPFVGGVLIDTLGWRSVFGFAFLIGSAITVAAYLTVYETRPRAEAGQSSGSILRNYVELFSHVRFTAFVLQTGFSTGTFITMATASSTLMKEFLNRPSTEFGAYFLLFPGGLLIGTFLSSRVGARGATETMVLLASILSVATATIQAILLLSGHVTGCDLLARILSNARPKHRAPIRSSGGHVHHSVACRDGVGRFRICAKPLRRRVRSAVRPGRGWDAGADDRGNGARLVPMPRGRRVTVFPRSAKKRQNLRCENGTANSCSIRSMHVDGLLRRNAGRVEKCDTRDESTEGLATHQVSRSKPSCRRLRCCETAVADYR
jgi:Major Facilitator Superfamily